MKNIRKLAVALLGLSLSFVSIAGLLAVPASAQVSTGVALQRGYRTGYSDGYMAGYRDVIDGKARDFTNHQDYHKADRAFNKDYGTIEDYRDGYRQGFEAGYSAGYEKKAFDATIPGNLAKRRAMDIPAATATTRSGQTSADEVNVSLTSETKVSSPESVATTNTTESPRVSTIQKVAYVSSDDPIIIVPRDTEIIIELDEALDTERNREGDKFTARVVSPVEIAGAVIEGHIEKVTRPGRLKRRSELLLAFDRIVLSERRWSNFNALVTEVLPVRGDNVKTVDDEGTAVGRGTLKNDSIKIGASTGTGATIGAITGGPVGAAIGAGVGAAFGVGSVVIERGKHIRLSKSQQLRIKSSYETQIR